MRIFLILLVAFSLNAQTAKWAQIGDLHIPVLGTTNGFNTLATYLETNNVQVLIVCGDVLEQTPSFWVGNYNGYSVTMPFYTNWLQGLVNSNIMVVQCDGNHDCDNTNTSQNWPAVAMGVYCNSTGPSNFWNSWFPLSFYRQQSGFITNMLANDSHNIVMAWTNGVDTFLFTTYEWPTYNTNTDLPGMYSNQTFWASGVAAQYSTHNAVCLAHYFISGHSMMESNSASEPWYFDIGPAWEPFVDGLQNAPNLMTLIGGHATSLISGHQTTNCIDGHSVDVSGLDLQQGNYVLLNQSNAPEDVVRLFTPNTLTKTMHAQTYCISLGRFLTNFDTYIAVNTNSVGVVAPTTTGHAGTYNRFVFDWYYNYAVPRQYTFAIP